MLILKNGDVITPQGLLTADVFVSEGKIFEIGTFPDRFNNSEAEIVDCSGLYIGPGFVDIHLHGGVGYDFVSEDTDGLIKAINYHLSQGTTSLTPACISEPFPVIVQAVKNLKSIRKVVKSSILGFHVEGVYLDAVRRGGHLLENLHNPDPAEYMPLINEHADFISEWTLAPELPGSLDLIKTCTRHGIVVSVGHSQADYDVMQEAIAAGLSHSTHFACAMGKMYSKELGSSSGKGYAPGVLELVLLDDRLTTEVIADGYHLHKTIIQLAIKCKGVDRVCLVSDSMKGVGLPDAEYVIGGQECVVKDSLAIIKERPQVIASSVKPLLEMFRFMVEVCDLPLVQAWQMASLTPARVIRADKYKGSIEKGKDADLVLLDKGLKIRSVFAGGELID